MLFQVEMHVIVPHGTDPEMLDRLKADEKARCQSLMNEGVWRHIWRVVGQYKNISIFDVPDNAALHDILMSLPLYRFMEIETTALCRHPSSVRSDDR